MFEVKPTLFGNRVILRPFTPPDIDAMGAVLADPAVPSPTAWTSRSCTGFRVLIGPAGGDRGLGTETTRLMVDHAFTTTSLYRIDLEVYAFNPHAQRAYEKAVTVPPAARLAVG